MLQISKILADQILNSRNAQGKCDFGYLCDYGAVVGSSEFVVYVVDDRDFWLVHKTELEENGPYIRIKRPLTKVICPANRKHKAIKK